MEQGGNAWSLRPLVLALEVTLGLHLPAEHSLQLGQLLLELIDELPERPAAAGARRGCRIYDALARQVLGLETLKVRG